MHITKLHENNNENNRENDKKIKLQDDGKEGQVQSNIWNSTHSKKQVYGSYQHSKCTAILW